MLFNQMTTNAAYNITYVSQEFEQFDGAYDTGVVDNFGIASQSTLTTVEAAVSIFSGAKDFSEVSGYRVEIYSSLAAAQNSLTGDVYHGVVPASAVTVESTDTTPGGNPYQVVSLPASTILNAGTYYLSVIGQLDYGLSGAEIGVRTAIEAGTDNTSYDVNPGEGFYSPPTYPVDYAVLTGDAGYEIDGIVPEPAGWMMLPLLGLMGLTMRRRSPRAALIV